MVPRRIESDSSLFKEWPLEHIKEIQRRRFVNQKAALEIFLITGKSIFINFPDGDANEVSSTLFRLRKKRCPNLIYYESLNPRKII